MRKEKKTCKHYFSGVDKDQGDAKTCFRDNYRTFFQPVITIAEEEAGEPSDLNFITE